MRILKRESLSPDCETSVLDGCQAQLEAKQHVSFKGDKISTQAGRGHPASSETSHEGWGLC